MGETTPAAYTETFGYDGFGNLTAKVLNGTSTAIAVNAATNRLTNASYDANGNMTSGAGATLVYDQANRVMSAAEYSGGTEYYGYAPDNKRILRVKTTGLLEFTLYGALGEKLGVFNSFLQDGRGVNTVDAVLNPVRSNVWFAGKLIYENGPRYTDRLGSALGRFYPYGEGIGAGGTPSTAGSDMIQFATYTRDSWTGLDYADQRYYASGYGRFNSPDRYFGSAVARLPLSWNRYSYVQGDPINFTDRTGNHVDCDGDSCDESEADCDWGDDSDGCIYDTGTVFYATGGSGDDGDLVADPDLGLDPTSGKPRKGNKNKKKKKGSGSSPYEQLKTAFDKVANAISSQANSTFSANLLDCWAGMESNFDPTAQTGTHQGLYQLNEAAWNASGIGVAFTVANTNNPATNAAAAVGYLTFLIQKYVDPTGFSSGNITTQDITQALTDYRWGPSSKKANDIYANDITKCASDLGSGNWNAAMGDLGR